MGLCSSLTVALKSSCLDGACPWSCSVIILSWPLSRGGSWHRCQMAAVGRCEAVTVVTASLPSDQTTCVRTRLSISTITTTGRRAVACLPSFPPFLSPSFPSFLPYTLSHTGNRPPLPLSQHARQMAITKPHPQGQLFLSESENFAGQDLIICLPIRPPDRNHCSHFLGKKIEAQRGMGSSPARQQVLQLDWKLTYLRPENQHQY